MKGAHILLGVTGSIAAFKAADLTAGLTQGGAEVTVIMTESAQRFVAPLTFETLARRPVITSLWVRTAEIGTTHVALADWADLLVVAPATADFIGRLAHGIADDVLSCTALAVARPPLIAPAMNDNMYRHPAVQENIRTLRRRGCTFVGPVVGRLASGKIALGRLSDVEDILSAIRRALKSGGRK